MTLNQAISRLQWRFQKPNPQNFTEIDIKAFNTMLKYINEVNRQTLDQNTLFAKLYVAVFKRTLDHYKCLPDDPIPQKELHRFLDLPLDEHYKRFHEYLNRTLLEKVTAQPGVTPADIANLEKYDLKEIIETLETQMAVCLNRFH